MRQARRSGTSGWRILDRSGPVPRILPPEWGPDERGSWPRVDFEVRDFGETIPCPACGESWNLREFDCVFGTARRSGNDFLVLVRCPGCRLPHRVRAVGFATAFPQVRRLMEGWLGWERRGSEFEAEERRLYGSPL